MAMSMHGAFNALMMTDMTLIKYGGGAYDDDNDWIVAPTTETAFKGVITTGNRFSQFDKGIALDAEDGGARFSDFKSLYVKDTVPIELGDRIRYRSKVYRTIQQTEENTFGFNGFMIEKEDNP